MVKITHRSYWDFRYLALVNFIIWKEWRIFDPPNLLDQGR
ncbi:unnamed protein product, partial [marine sediment metagenome]